MEWTTEHVILFCREVIAFDLYQYKPGSKERGQCLNKIAESPYSTEEPWFKVDQRLLRGRIKKLLKQFVVKRNKDLRESGTEVEHTELDDLHLDTHKQQQQAEVEAAEVSEINTRNLKTRNLTKKDEKQKKLDCY